MADRMIETITPVVSSVACAQPLCCIAGRRCASQRCIEIQRVPGPIRAERGKEVSYPATGSRTRNRGRGAIKIDREPHARAEMVETVGHRGGKCHHLALGVGAAAKRLVNIKTPRRLFGLRRGDSHAGKDQSGETTPWIIFRQAIKVGIASVGI